LQSTNWLGRMALLSLILLLLLFGWSSRPVVRGQATDVRQIIVTGQAQLEVEPDGAMIRLGVETHHSVAQEAQEENSRIMGRVLGELSRLGIPEDAVRTSRFEVQPQGQYGPEYEGIVGYRVINEVTITTDELDAIGLILDTAVKAGANTISSIELTVEDVPDWELQALDLAVQKAHEKGEAIANALGIEIKGIHSVADHSQIQGVNFFVADGMAPIKLGPVVVTSQVEIQFEI
jgi:uncharacterized protein YggE